MNPVHQIYSHYTEEDFKVWKILFDRQMKNLENKVASDYLVALNKIKFSANEIPDFNVVNRILQSETKWSLQTVPNISPVNEFFNYLTRRKFTATCWLRKMEQLDYLEEPDMFHDVFAHTPLLTSNAYCAFFEKLGQLAMQNSANPEIIIKLSRLYWYTIEFGLVYENRNIKIYGAGIISSAGETGNAFNNRSQKLDFDIKRIVKTDYRGDLLQDKYFVIESFDQLLNAIPEIEKIIKEED